MLLLVFSSLSGSAENYSESLVNRTINLILNTQSDDLQLKEAKEELNSNQSGIMEELLIRVKQHGDANSETDYIYLIKNGTLLHAKERHKSKSKIIVFDLPHFGSKYDVYFPSVKLQFRSGQTIEFVAGSYTKGANKSR